MRGKKGLTGKRFGRLTVISDAGTDKEGQLLWKCECKCGKFTKARTQELQQGKKKHCGCLLIHDVLLAKSDSMMRGEDTLWDDEEK